MVTIAGELFEVLTKHPNKSSLQLLNNDEKCSKNDLQNLKAKLEGHFMIDTMKSISKTGKTKPDGIFNFFPVLT